MAIHNPVTGGYKGVEIEGPFSLLGDAAGWTAGKAAKMVGKGALFAGKNIGKAGFFGAKMAGKAAMKTASGLGSAAIGTAKFTNKAADKMFESKIASRFAKNTGEFIGSFVKYTPEHQRYNPITRKLEERAGEMKLTGKGKLLVAGAALLAGAIKANQENNAYHMGQIDSQVQTATPDYQVKQYDEHPSHSYLDNAGATGGLVFALNALRHG